MSFTLLPPGDPLLAAVLPGPDLAAAGYRQEEYVASGTAARFERTGAGDVVPIEEAAYATRVLVRAPGDPTRCSGVVVVEWLNVSSGSDAAPDYTYLAEEIVRRGHGWVGVSAQQVGVSGGQPSVGGAPTPGLRGIVPERYGALVHPGDGYSYDLFSRIAAGLTEPGGPLVDHGITRRIAVGESQSAFAMTTYVNAFAATAGVFHAFLIHSRGRYELGLGQAGEPADLLAARSGPAVPIREDLTTPVLLVQTETDVASPRFRSVDARQSDGPMLRLWEVAGASHADVWQIGDFESLLGCPDPVNRGQQAYVLRAGLRALETWVDDATAPPVADRLSVVGEDYETDEVGNVRGGVRTPCVDAPTQVLSGIASPEAPFLCSLFGSTRDLPPEAVAGRYDSVEDYLTAYVAATDRAISAGFLLVEDRDAVLAEARPGVVAAALG
ncbi:alpha/beta hydrolase domain-containing protein [Nocardioides stalactiti]|uniref:alpha/beta hydrolase domain-containing protein n=1 Tax=Nocardioides stalactiti TaxID=2755356 RepID=UPI0015FEFC22|nr:alpha/beta hydrolase domain-containing protein [Nocardioides stalactiti]